MKKIKLLLLSLLILVMPMFVNAASGSISVTGSSQVVVGNKVTVTVTLSSATPIGSWQMSLNYDNSYLQFLSSTAEAGGTVMAASSASGVKSKSYTFTFKALKSGTTNVGVGSYLAYAFSDLSEIGLSANTKAIRILTQAELEASYSKDNNLKSLSVEGYEITPEFKSDVTEYSVIVPENTKKIVINAVKNDSKASVSGTGEVDVTDGINKFNIVVSAENGAEKTYTLNVEVKDTNPINVKVDNENYTVVKVRENLKTPTAYTEKTITIEGIEVPAYYSDITGYTLVGLKSSDGKISLYIYDNGLYSRYLELKSGNITIIPQELNETIKNYIKGTIKIQNEEIDCLTIKTNSRFKVISGMNIETKEVGLYVYDTKDQTIMKYDDELSNMLNEKNTMLTYVAILFGCTTLISLIITISVSKKKKKVEKTQKTKEVKNQVSKEKLSENKNEVDSNAIIEKESSEEVYDIFEDEHKKKNKKK